MIWILGDTRRNADRLSRAVDGPACLVNAGGDLPANYRRGGCLVVCRRTRFQWEHIRVLTAIARKSPWLPLILVTDREARATRLLSRVSLSALVWFEDVHTHLQPRIEGALAASPLAHVARTIRHSPLPPALQASLAHSLRKAGSTPVGTVKELANTVGRSRVTLCQEFGACARGATTFARFLSALVILRAHELRSSGLNWQSVSTELEFRRSTLSSKARVWPGCTLSALERVPRNRLLAGFVSEHVAPLLGQDLPDTLDPVARWPHGWPEVVPRRAAEPGTRARTRALERRRAV